MYELLINRLDAAGYEHYEISNWARKAPSKEETSSDNDGKSPWRSLHNSSYWNQTPYIGIGAAAHSYDGATRSWNVSNLQQYVSAIESGQRPYESEIIDDDTRYNDIVTTALRTREGINLNVLSACHRQYLLQQARRSLDAGLLAITDTPAGESFIHLTRQGLFVSDDVMSDLIWV
jgi:oxygen-independent coproporphyrinogen-3 oxidase